MQERFLASKKRIKVLLAANKIGKCLTYRTLIDSPTGESKKIGEIKGKHWVWAWTGTKKLAVLADEPFKKPAEECYRVWLSNGNWFECAANHRILTSEGWHFFSDLSRFVPCLPEDVEYPSSHEPSLHQGISFSLVSPDSDETNKIVAYQPIGINDIYDFHVPEYHNYCTAGIVHHNTAIGAIETLRFASQGSGKVIRIIGSLGFDKGIKDTIYPELIKWMPKSMLIHEKKNSQGVVVHMIVKSSEGENIISLMSGEQDAMSFEGDLVDFVWIDEPPKRFIYSASLRALLISNGPMIMTFTPLSEPWVYNDIYLKFGIDPEIDIIQGSMYDALVENGGHLTIEQIENFAKRIPEEERDSRIYGKFKHLVGRVYKGFDKEKHCVPPFAVPKDWPVYCAIDPHLKKPNAAIFLACSPEEDWYVVNEVYWKANIEDFGREVKAVSEQYNLISTFIDTSSETPDWNRRETARTILNKVGVKTRLARKKGNRETARFIIGQALEGKDGSGTPWLYVFKNCPRTIFEFENYVWDSKQSEDKEQPIKVNDDCLDGLGYIVIEKPRYSKPRIITL